MAVSQEALSKIYRFDEFQIEARKQIRLCHGKPVTLGHLQAVCYIRGAGKVGNIWSLPFKGTASKPLTTFTSHWLSDFSLSTDGRWLAVTRTLNISDEVLIENVASP